MRVGLEATVGLAHRFTGVQRYVLELARSLAVLGAGDLRCEMLLRAADFRKRRLKPEYPWPVRWYCSGVWPALPLCDVLHGLGTRLPRTLHGVARVSTMHDLSPLSLPRYGSERTLQNTLHRYDHAAAAADRIIAVSGATKADFLHYFDFPEHRVDVVHLGLSAAFTEQEGNGTAASASRQATPFFIAFGGNPRKNLARTLEAFARTPLRSAFELRVVGALNAADHEALVRGRLEKLVRLEPNRSDDEMAQLYRCSAGLLFPSLLEGFGLPILEAMACGVPVLTSARPATTEIAGGHAVLVDPESIGSIADGMERLSSIEAVVLRRASAYARSFTWRRAAEQTLAVYRAALAARTAGARAPRGRRRARAD
jgi:alpha-1,3-rhamnosyl/mannosyltransferase